MKPKVTVLTCVYNGLPYLKDSIDSILSQTYSDFEYLIIDDASPDNNVIKLRSNTTFRFTIILRPLICNY